MSAKVMAQSQQPDAVITKVQMYIDLANSIAKANSDENTSIVAITGTGKYFTSGNEFSNFHSSTSRTDKVSLAVRVTVMIDRVRNFLNALINLRKPLFGLINGPAVGIGVTMLGHCDAVYSTKSAYFTTPFTALGVCPEACSSYIFPRLMGHMKASNLLMLNAKLSADEALSYGIVTKVIPDDEFDDATKNILKSTLQLPIQALMAAKELIRGHERQKLHLVNGVELRNAEKL